MRQAEGEHRVHLHPVVVLQQRVCQRLCPQWDTAYERVATLLQGAVRASSAVEPTFKGVWYAAVNFAPLPPLDTRPDQYLQPHR